MTCHGTMEFKMCVSDFEDVRTFINAVNELLIESQSQYKPNEYINSNNGTYCFPSSFLKNVKNNGYVCGMSMGLGENRKLANAYEIESTFRMLLIKKRLNLL